MPVVDKSGSGKFYTYTSEPKAANFANVDFIHDENDGTDTLPGNGGDHDSVRGRLQEAAEYGEVAGREYQTVADQQCTPDEWTAIVERLPLQGPASQLAQHTTLVERRGGRFRLMLEPDGEHRSRRSGAA